MKVKICIIKYNILLINSIIMVPFVDRNLIQYILLNSRAGYHIAGYISLYSYSWINIILSELQSPWYNYFLCL